MDRTKDEWSSFLIKSMQDIARKQVDIFDKYPKPTLESLELQDQVNDDQRVLDNNLKRYDELFP